MSVKIDYWAVCDNKDCSDMVWFDAFSISSTKVLAQGVGWIIKKRGGREIMICPKCQSKTEDNGL